MDSRADEPLGNYAVVAEWISDAGEVLVERVGVEPGIDVLDVGTGTGNAALPAAQRGARVIGLDRLSELLDVARERAADLAIEVDWVLGDAEQLPFEGARFDRVLSVFGHMFAPRHERTAAELVRVCRPGGAIGFCAWTPEGVGGRLLEIASSFLPPAPPSESPSVRWGSEDHVRKMFGGNVSSLEFERRAITFREETPEAWVVLIENSFRPLVSARARLGERWGELRAGILRVIEEANEADDGTLRYDQEYLLTVARL